MAETTVRGSAIVRNATPQANSSKPHATTSGVHPVVNVNMNAGGPQIQGGQQVRQGVTILPPKAGQRNFTTGGLPNQPAKQSVVISAPKGTVGHAPPSGLTSDQLLLCRHLATKYVDDQRALGGDQIPEEMAANIQLAEATIMAIDAAMTAMTAAAAAAAVPVQPSPPQRSVANQRSVQVAASAAPRRVSRPGPPPPPIVVTMDAGQPVPVQSQDPSVVVQTPPDDAQG
jgi:hypothetical protein